MGNVTVSPPLAGVVTPVRTASSGASSDAARLLDHVDRWRMTLTELWPDSQRHRTRRRVTDLSSTGATHLRLAAQRFVDCAVFLRMCEARGIEPEGSLYDIAESGAPSARFATQVGRARARYGSSLLELSR